MLIEELSSKRKREKWRKKEKKGEQKLALSFFFCARKYGDCSRKFRRHGDSGHDSSVCRQNGFAAQDQSSKCQFPRSALQTSPYDDRKNTKISTTCTYYREILTVRALRSSRTIEYYVLLSLRTIEKRKDWIWIGFQSGPAIFVRTIENYVLLSIRTIEKWLYQLIRTWTELKLQSVYEAKWCCCWNLSEGIFSFCMPCSFFFCACTHIFLF